MALDRRKEPSGGWENELRERLGRAPKDLDEVIADMARSIAKRKQKKAAAKLMERYQTRDEIERLFQAVLVARPFARAMNEAGEPGDEGVQP